MAGQTCSGVGALAWAGVGLRTIKVKVAGVGVWAGNGTGAWVGAGLCFRRIARAGAGDGVYKKTKCYKGNWKISIKSDKR